MDRIAINQRFRMACCHDRAGMFGRERKAFYEDNRKYEKRKEGMV
jgi:hypothetical protein